MKPFKENLLLVTCVCYFNMIYKHLDEQKRTGNNLSLLIKRKDFISHLCSHSVSFKTKEDENKKHNDQ